jgi:hypothetical protein
VIVKQEEEDKKEKKVTEGEKEYKVKVYVGSCV